MTEADVKRALDVMVTVLQIVREAGADGLPEGPLYAHLMGHMDIGTFERLVQAMLKTKLVERRAHVLYWKGDAAA